MIKTLEKNRIIPSIITLLITAEIFYFSSLTGGTLGTGNIWISRAYHFIVFFLFSFFFFIVIKGREKIKIKHLLIVLIVSITHAFLDEFHQSFVPGRNPDIQDILTDLSGIFSSIIIYKTTIRMAKTKR
mgnify:CR=1 FL=1